jgi:hypothetical protein
VSEIVNGRRGFPVALGLASLLIGGCYASHPGAPVPPTTPASAVTPEPFPRVMLWGGINGRGWPLLVTNRSSSAGRPTVDSTVIRSIAKFSAWADMPVDLYDERRDLYVAVRNAARAEHGRDIRIWAHVLGPTYWSAGPRGWAGRLQAAIGSRYLRKRDGSPWHRFYARIDEPAVQDILVAAWSELLKSGCYDGLMLDWYGTYDQWMVALDPTLDLTEWGGNVDTWAASMAAGKQAALAKLRVAFPQAILVGNGGPRGPELASGWFRENFPNQNGGTWASNVLAPNGLISDVSYYGGSPRYSVIAVNGQTFNPREAMLGLVSSCLGDGIFTCGPGNYDPAIDYRDWWLPVMEPGWLGQPLGMTTRAPLPGHESNVYRRDFEHGIAWVDPTTLASGFVRK